MEWAASFLGSSFIPPSPPKSSNRDTGLFGPSDVMLQYVELFKRDRP